MASIERSRLDCKRAIFDDTGWREETAIPGRNREISGKGVPLIL